MFKIAISRLLSHPLKFTSTTLCICLLAACGNKEAPQTTEQTTEVEVITLQEQDVPLTIELVGQTKGAVDAEIRARVEGNLQGIHFSEGKGVTEGQLLYTIDPTPFNAKLTEMKAKLIEAETRLVKADADLGRIRPLAKMKAVSERDLDGAVAQQGVAKGAVEVAKAGVELAAIELSYTKITAPLAGIIGLTKARVGEFVGKPPNAVVLNTVSQLDPIHVRFSVTEQEYLYFARQRQQRENSGEPAKVRKLQMILADGSVHPQEGTIASADSQIDPATGSLAVEASFPNPGQVIRPGQFAKIKAEKDLLKGVLAIPRKAVRDLQGIKQVQLVKADSSVEFRSVTIKEDVGDLLVVKEGVAKGEKIIPEIQPRLRAGSIVRIVEKPIKN